MACSSCNSMIASPSSFPESYYDGYEYDSGCGCNQQQVALQPAFNDYVQPQQLAVQPVYNDYIQAEQAPVYEELGTPAYALDAPLEQVYDQQLIRDNYVEQPVCQQQTPLVYQQQPVVYEQQQQPIVYEQQQQPIVYEQQQQPIVYQQQQQPVVYQQQQPIVYQQQQQQQLPVVYQQQQPQQTQVAYYQQPARQIVSNDCGCNRVATATPVQYIQRPIQQAQAPTPATFVKNVETTLNRHHLHTIRYVDNTNNYNTYLTNHITKVNDIHHYRVENVKGETRTFNDYKQTQTVEPARCINGNCGNN